MCLNWEEKQFKLMKNLSTGTLCGTWDANCRFSGSRVWSWAGWVAWPGATCAMRGPGCCADTGPWAEPRTVCASSMWPSTMNIPALWSAAPTGLGQAQLDQAACASPLPSERLSVLWASLTLSQPPTWSLPELSECSRAEPCPRACTRPPSPHLALLTCGHHLLSLSPDLPL